MSRQLEQGWEDRSKRERAAVVQAVYGGITEAVSASGGTLLGFSVKLSGTDCLITLRAMQEDKTLIAFVGAEDLPAALRKVVREGHTEQLRWRASKYG